MSYPETYDRICATHLGEIFPSLSQRGLDANHYHHSSSPSGVVTEPDGLARPAWAVPTKGLRDYYDNEWGVPIVDEHGLFELLSLEVFQAGLSWRTVLSRRESLRQAFSGFIPEVVAEYGPEKVEELVHDQSVIRNRRKIQAVITNAQATVELRSHGGLAQLIWSYQPEKTPCPQFLEDLEPASTQAVQLATDLKSAGFVFVGPKTIYALMQAAGVLDAHLEQSHRRGSSGLWNPDGTRAKKPELVSVSA